MHKATSILASLELYCLMDLISQQPNHVVGLSIKQTMLEADRQLTDFVFFISHFRLFMPIASCGNDAKKITSRGNDV